ncbi:MAG: DUF1361 domain-containing protein [Candidatus Parcubacteria bacterium]|nr:DUF1361 domain-containing protein [Candidatus Parcubacteria bacterium]
MGKFSNRIIKYQVAVNKLVPVKWHLFLLLFVFSIFNTSLVFFRIYYSSFSTFRFLIWNLLLAWIPYLISLAVIKYSAKINNKIFIILLIFCWLLFFPNAPYIFTDLFHLRPRGDVPFWYDMILIISFAINGWFLGIISLINIQNYIKNSWSLAKSWVVAISALFLASFGIYLGRFLRWNSWDLLFNPLSLLADVWERIIYPLEHFGTFAFTVLIFVFLSLNYLIVRAIVKDN